MNAILAQNLALAAALIAAAFAVRAFLRAERWERAIRRLRQNRLGAAAAGVVAVYLLLGAADLAVVGAGPAGPVSALDRAFAGVPREAGYSAPWARVDLDGKPLRGFHFLGTDALGKDVLLQTLKGCRTALLIGGLTSLIAIPIGTVLGICAGYFKRRVDDAIQYIYSTVASVPGILLLVAILLVLGKGMPQMTLALGLTGWIGLCRLLRGETLRQTERPYCEAARAMGLGHRRIVLRHVLPNVMHLIVIQFVLGFSGIVLAESMLSYLGVGLPIGTASWGAMIDGARMELSREPGVWWNLGAATGALFGLVLALNLLGDALRKAFDPRAQ
jgi:peptide/nickel transport system permease protein